MSWFSRKRLRPATTLRLQLESLEDRLVPSTLDLTTRGAQGVLNGALFQQCDAQPTGTGVIRSFVRLQTNAATEQGYNTDARPLQFDENNSPQFTRSQLLSGVPRVTIGTTVYRQFLLDINQKASQPLLSLDELRLYVGNSQNLSGYDPATKQLAGLSPVYDLGDNWVKLNYRLNPGSGAGDMFVYIPDDSFSGATASSYVYLYSKFGVNNAANSGFEEWAVRNTGVVEPPPPGPASLSGFVYLDANNNGVFDAGETGISGVTVTLRGTDDLGNTVVVGTLTDANGFYSFTGLRAGTYSLLETQPTGYLDGQDTIGTQGGLVSNDLFYDIVLQLGVDGKNNNFGELLAGS
jgi:SdrD B-like domain